MTTEERSRLNELMGRVADGDNDALFTLHEEFGHILANKMRSHLRGLNARQPDPYDLDGLVIDAWLCLADCAPAWDPDGGALPWNWANLRLRKVASDWVGQYADELDEAVTRHPAAQSAPTGTDERHVLIVLDELAARDETIGLFREALRLTASERDQVVVLEVRQQAALGDPSPASTVAVMMDMSPVAVRKVNSRWRVKVHQLAEDDPRFAPVADLDIAA